MFGIFIEALRFAADKHLMQRRKGCDQVPYINHPIKVVELLRQVGKECDVELLSAAILHDVLEDTNATVLELREKFGDKITNLVIELTDDMTLTYDERKREQIKKAPNLTDDAKKIKVADKISNMQDIVHLPLTWSNRRKRQYFEWSERVVRGCRGINPYLDQAFDEILQEGSRFIENRP